MARKIAAVNRGDVPRIKRAKVKRIIPVVEVATESLQPVHCRESGIQSLCRFMCARPAEILRGDRGQEVQAEIRGRSPMGYCRGRFLLNFLKIVRWQHVFRCGDKRIEKPPGAAGDEPQKLCISSGDGHGFVECLRAARPLCHEG